MAGKLEFSLTAVPLELLYTLRVFAATRRGDLNELKNIVESSKSSDLIVPYIAVDSTNTNRYSTISVTSNQGVDVNVEYLSPAYADDAFFGQSFNRRRSSVHMVRNVTILSPHSPLGACVGEAGGGVGGCGMSPEDHRLLLHIAIENHNLEIVSYLLSQGANVSTPTMCFVIAFVCVCMALQQCYATCVSLN